MQIDKLLFHQRTQNQLLSVLERPGSGLLLSGPAGSGKSATALQLAADLLAAEPGRLANQPGLITIDKPDDKSEIPIEKIRQLSVSLSLKMPQTSQRPINRIVIINDSQYLSQEAQNALLKLAEEPPPKTLIILTVDSPENLLPTVVSRLQKLSLSPPTLSQSRDFFKAYPSQKVDSAWQLSRGGAGLMSALLAEDNDHQLKQAVAQAKQFLAARTYQRLILLKQFDKDKAGLALFLDALARTLAALNQQTVQRGRAASTKKVIASRKAVEQAIDQTAQNTNTRLILLSLALGVTL